MANDAHIVFAGYAATDPVYWPNEEGRSKATLRVAYTPRYLDRTGEWTDSPTTFLTVTCWRKLADNVAVCLRKGVPVLVQGRLHVRRYDDREGNPRTSVDVDAQSIGYDLSRGVAWFQRTRRVTADAVAPAGAQAPGSAGPGTAGAQEATGGTGTAREDGGASSAGGGPAGVGEEDELPVLDDSVVASLLSGSGYPGGDGGPLGEDRELDGDGGLQDGDGGLQDGDGGLQDGDGGLPGGGGEVPGGAVTMTAEPRSPS